MKTSLIRKIMMGSGIVCLVLAGCNAKPIGVGKDNGKINEPVVTQAGLTPQAEIVLTSPDSMGGTQAAQELVSEVEVAYQPPQTVDSEIELEITPLDMQSGSAEIQDRIAQSQSLWRSVWLEGLITWYPQDGGQTSSQVYRGQVWFDQSEMSFRSLIGSPGKDPASAKISNGESIFEFDPFSGNGTSTNLPTFAKQGVNLAGIVGSPLSELLFSGALAQRGGNYAPVFTEKIAGRPALVVDWRSDGAEQPVDRFWVDVQTGVFLRMQHFSKAGGDVVSSDIAFTQIFYNLDFTDELFRLPLVDMPIFQEDWSKVSEVPRRSVTSAPPAADSQSGEIYFNWFAPEDGTPRLMRLSVPCLVNNTRCSEAEVVTNVPESSASSQSFPVSLVWSPDGSSAAATLISDVSGRLVTKLFIYQPEGDNWTLLGEFDLIDAVQWSQDGQWIGFLTNQDGYKIYAIRVDGTGLQELAAGEPVSVEDTSTEILQMIGWHEGSLYFLQTIQPFGTSNKIHKTRPEDGVVELVGEFTPAQVGQSIIMTADGQAVTIAYDDQFRYLNIVDLSVPNLRRLISFKKSHSFFSGSPDGQWVAFTMTSDPANMDFKTDIFAVRPDGTDMRQLAAFDNYLEGVTFSPDSLFLLVHGGDVVGQLFLISLEDGSQRLLQIPGVPLGDRIGQVSWRPAISQ